MTRAKEIGYDLINVVWKNIDGFERLWGNTNIEVKDKIVNDVGDLAVNLVNGMENSIDSKIKQLFDLTDEFIYMETYSHTNKMMWKISNIYTDYHKDILVLCEVDKGIEMALDIAIAEISKKRNLFYGKEILK